jgi:hypothetical protein
MLVGKKQDPLTARLTVILDGPREVVKKFQVLPKNNQSSLFSFRLSNSRRVLLLNTTKEDNYYE